MLEFPGNGFGDFREAAYTIRQSDGSRVSHFVFSDYQIQQGKPALAGLLSDPWGRRRHRNTDSVLKR